MAGVIVKALKVLQPRCLNNHLVGVEAFFIKADIFVNRVPVVGLPVDGIQPRIGQHLVIYTSALRGEKPEAECGRVFPLRTGIVESLVVIQLLEFNDAAGTWFCECRGMFVYI